MGSVGGAAGFGDGFDVFLGAGFPPGLGAVSAVFRAPGFPVGWDADHWPTHSSSTRQVVPRAGRPVSMPRWPPGTISTRTSGEPVRRGTTALTALTDAMASVEPARTRTGTVTADSSTVRSASS